MSLTRKDVHVEMSIIDGSILKGTMVIERTCRLSDTLNKHDREFVVLSDYDDNHHIINKRHIVRVIEIDSLELEEPVAVCCG